jgi:cephalosporin hydroxylase
MSLGDRVSRIFKVPQGALRLLTDRSIHWVVGVHNLLKNRTDSNALSSSGLPELDEIKARSQTRTDISDHLVTLFVESLTMRPRLIVELGVRGGESTYVLERVARLCESRLVSVDIEDCSFVSNYARRTFVKSDDITFAAQFPRYCRDRGAEPEIDVLFIDTSHLFEHTVQEIRHWFPFLSARAVVFFHDTNLRKIYFRKDGSMGIGWDNHRGVIAAIERFMGRSLDETDDFICAANGWLIRHHASCAGFTVLKRIDVLASPDSNGA